MLIGEGVFAAIRSQLAFDMQAYEQVRIEARKAWRQLLLRGDTSLDLTSIPQGAEEPFQDFVAHL